MVDVDFKVLWTLSVQYNEILKSEIESRFRLRTMHDFMLSDLYANQQLDSLHGFFFNCSQTKEIVQYIYI